MLQVFANSVDITANVSKNSIRIAEQMNNRANTCSFSVEDYSVGEGAKIEVFEGFTLTSEATSGQAVLNASDTFEFEWKFKAGDEIIVDIKGANQKFYTIQSVDHTVKTITLETNLTTTLPAASNCGRLVFSGITMKNPDEEIGVSWKFTFRLSATDWTKMFDSKLVVDSYQNQYSREMFGRVVYEFTANDAETNLDLFESAWTEGGVALAMTADTSDRIQWTNSMKTGTSGAGTATWTKTISSADLSSMDRFRIWWKISEPYWSKISSVKIRVWSDASNYVEGSSDWIGHNDEECWNFDSFDFWRSTIVWSPNQAAITWLQIEVVATATIPDWNLHFDHALASAGWYTVKNCIRGDRKFVDVRASYKKPTVFVDDISKLQNFFWFIDYERNLHFFKNDSTPAPFSLTDTSENFADLSITADISSLKNRQTVRGWIAVDQNTYTQDEVCDGKVESWRLDYPPKDLQIWVDTTWTWSSFVQKTVGVENLTDPATVEYLFNFNEKVVRRSTDSILPSGTIFRRIYYPYKPIRVRVQSQPSIDAMKVLLGGDWIFDWSVINDSSIRDWNEARIRAKAEVDAYSNQILTADFKTQQDGLKAGQIIHITDTDRWIDNDFLIQKISKSSRNDDRWTYSVDCWSTMFWIIEFFQLLLKKTEILQVDVSEIIDIVVNDDETITISPSFTFTKKDSTFRVAANLTKWIDFTYETGSFNSAWPMIDSGKNTMWTMAESGTEAATVNFNGSSRYNAGKEMKLTTTVGWSGQTLTVTPSARFLAKSGASAAFSIWFAIDTALTGTGGFSVSVKEYAAASGGSVLATTSIVSNAKTVRDFNRTRQTFTTNASTNFVEIELKIDNAVWSVSVGEMIFEDLTLESVTNPAVASFSQAI